MVIETNPKPEPVTEPGPQRKTDSELIEEVVEAQAQFDEAKERLENLKHSILWRIKEKPTRKQIQNSTHQVLITEYWPDKRYDPTKLIQFREKADIATGELLYGSAWIPENTIVIPGHWDTTKLKALAKRHGDYAEVEAAKLTPQERIKIQRNK